MRSQASAPFSLRQKICKKAQRRNHPRQKKRECIIRLRWMQETMKRKRIYHNHTFPWFSEPLNRFLQIKDPHHSLPTMKKNATSSPEITSFRTRQTFQLCRTNATEWRKSDKTGRTNSHMILPRAEKKKKRKSPDSTRNCSSIQLRNTLRIRTESQRRHDRLLSI